MRAFGPVVHPLALEMTGAVQTQITERGLIGRVLVRDLLARSDALLLEELARQLAGHALVPLGLDWHIKELAFGIDGTPQVHLLAHDPDEHLVQMPPPERHRALRS